MMNTIDCLLVGPHEVHVSKYEKMLRSADLKSPFYRELNLKFLKHDNKVYRIPELLESFSKEEPLNGAAQNGTSEFNVERILAGGILYLGSYLDKHGFTFDYINSFKMQREEFAEILRSNNVVTVVLVSTVYFTPLPIREVINFIRKHNSKAKVLVGGPYIWSQVRLMSESELFQTFDLVGADIFVDNAQGETTLKEIITALKNGTPLSDVPNLYFKEGAKYIKTAPKPENNGLEENMIRWNLFQDKIDTQVYSRTALSCPYDCAFCDFPVRVGSHTTMSVESVERELDAIEATGRVRTIRFLDDTFNVPLRRFKEIVKMMIRNKYSFKWSSFLRCQYIDKELIELMAESGCEACHLGFESGSETVLRNMSKRSKISQYEYGLSLLNDNNIVSFSTFIIGYPGETEETVRETISFIENSRPTFYYLHLFFCSPLTPVWQHREKFQIKGWGLDWEHATMDSARAFDIIEEMIVSIKNSTYCGTHPEYITYLRHHGVSWQRIKNFLGVYNEGMRDKLLFPDKQQIDDGLMQRMKRCLYSDDIVSGNGVLQEHAVHG